MVLLESQRVLKRGDTAPDFDLLGTDGKRHSRIQYGGRPLLVVFMCNHCPYVKAQTDSLNGLYKQYEGRISMVGINSNDSVAYPEDSYDNMKSVAAEKGFGFEYVIDKTQDVAKSYGAKCTPDPFLFDQNHKLVFHGKLDSMTQNIATILRGDPIQKDFDPSIGCSIKWRNP